MLFPSQNIVETSTFHHIFTSFHSGWGVQYYKWKPSDKPSPSDLAKYQYFHARTLLSFLPFEEKLALFIAKRFLKYLLFTTYSLFMRVSEVCNTSNKCWLPNKSTIKIFLHKTPHNPPLFPYFQSLLFSFSLTRYIGRILLLLLFVHFKSRTVIICKKIFLLYNFQSLLTALSGSANKEGMFYPQKKSISFQNLSRF